MSGRVGVLRCRYRGHGAAADPREVARLDRVATERLPAELDRALGELADTDAVYVVRTVRVGSALRTDPVADAQLARSWGDDLARSVARTIADGGADVRHFESRVDYVVAFLADLLAGVAWQRWYFGAFRGHRHRSTDDVVVAVLDEHRDVLAAVLAGLARRGLLETLLARVDVARLELGERAAPVLAASDTAVEVWRSIVARAWDVVDRLGWWRGDPPEAPAVLREWAARRRPQPDWRDPAALADAVAAVIAWLVRCGHASAAGTGAAGEAVVGLDWLDRGRLVDALTAIVAHGAGSPLRPPSATPRQRALLTALARAVRSGRPRLHATAPHDAADIARVLAVLADTEPDAAGDPLAARLVGQVLAAAAALGPAATSPAVREAIASSDRAAAEVAWRAVTGRAADGPTTTALDAAARLGGPVAEVLAAVAGPDPQGGDPDGASFTSPVAGLLLLARPLQDTRLAGLATRAGYPDAGTAYLLAALGVRWAGDDGIADGVLDPAVRLLAGDPAPRTVADLDRAWHDVAPAAHARWRAGVDELLDRHRVGPAAPRPDPLDHTADAVLRVWARWLRGFEGSTPPFLLERFVRRPGTVAVSDSAVTVRLPRRPLDTVLEMSGVLSRLEPLPGAAARRIVFAVGDP